MKATDITNLLEQHDSYIKVRGKSFELFGPSVTVKELNDVGGDGGIRFIANYDKKELWAWNAKMSKAIEVMKVHEDLTKLSNKAIGKLIKNKIKVVYDNELVGIITGGGEKKNGMMTLDFKADNGILKWGYTFQFKVV
jgi:hypothetical protein